MKIVLETPDSKVMQRIVALAKQLGVHKITQIKTEASAPAENRNALKALTEANLFQKISDPVKWQRSVRQDRELFTDEQ